MLERMDKFFDSRLDEYDAHQLGCIASAREFLRFTAEQLPSGAGCAVLDLGCGSDGRLVLFLRQQGLAAFGIDRFAPAGEHFVQGDWFAFDIGSRAWGTIIAHHTISTHFVYSHSHQLPIVRQYAQLYRQILRSLAVGGAFCYAPGVPFFEARIASLPAYTVTKTPIPLNDQLGIGAIAYATRIRRIV